VPGPHPTPKRQRRGSVLTTLAGALAVTAILGYVVADSREEFGSALGAAPLWILLVATALQLLALVSRTESWRICVATAVLIAMVTLSQLPVGPSVGAAAVVLILGADGAALAAAGGVLLTATGTLGALAYAGWTGIDRLWMLRPAARRRKVPARPHLHPSPDLRPAIGVTR
jgi:hypothetical protein